MAISDRLENELRAILPSAGDAMLKQMIWNAINEACREGHIWRETVPVDLVAGDTIYTPAPVGAEIVHVYSVSHPTIDLTSNSVYYEFGKLYLKYAPTIDEALEDLYMVAALTPAIDAGADVEALLPSDMWSTHHQLLFAGVMGLMCAQPAKPYTNPQLGAYYRRDFKGRLAQAKREAQTGGIPGAQTWRFPRWAPGARR